MPGLFGRVKTFFIIKKGDKIKKHVQTQKYDKNPRDDIDDAVQPAKEQYRSRYQNIKKHKNGTEPGDEAEGRYDKMPVKGR
jgi:hypothetical protein